MFVVINQTRFGHIMSVHELKAETEVEAGFRFGQIFPDMPMTICSEGDGAWLKVTMPDETVSKLFTVQPEEGH